ncbi:MAG: hypothetical protein EZS28_030006 [Streblomastix strix]|uniref:Replication factor Mcm10 C-terminal domain-containing protein n=1 Tax=Streblomastix strix TaxID=222440 RepID=A0A5J4UV00_9EUKA|nr:MAG: hypothetical protein EZS28_030006 [Streblomastix strix]
MLSEAKSKGLLAQAAEKIQPVGSLVFQREQQRIKKQMEEMRQKALNQMQRSGEQLQMKDKNINKKKQPSSSLIDQQMLLLNEKKSVRDDIPKPLHIGQKHLSFFSIFFLFLSNQISNDLTQQLLNQVDEAIQRAGGIKNFVKQASQAENQSGTSASSHAEGLLFRETEEIKQKLGFLEQKERVAEKMAKITKVKTRAFYCSVCGVISEKRKQICLQLNDEMEELKLKRMNKNNDNDINARVEDERERKINENGMKIHEITQINTWRRFFECSKCHYHITIIHDPFPLFACPKCNNQSSWVQASMYDENKLAKQLKQRGADTFVSTDDKEEDGNNNSRSGGTDRNFLSGRTEFMPLGSEGKKRRSGIDGTEDEEVEY